MILKFDEFVFEADSTAKIVDLLVSLTRNYDSTNNFYNSEASHFVIDKEEREWKDLRQSAKLEKTSTTDGNYILDFDLDKKEYKLFINFEMSFFGQNEKDSPEPGNEFTDRVAAVLDKIEVKKIKIDSQFIKYESERPNSQIRKATEDFMIKALTNDYDSLSSRIYSIQQK